MSKLRFWKTEKTSPYQKKNLLLPPEACIYQDKHDADKDFDCAWCKPDIELSDLGIDKPKEQYEYRIGYYHPNSVRFDNQVPYSYSNLVTSSSSSQDALQAEQNALAQSAIANQQNVRYSQSSLQLGTMQQQSQSEYAQNPWGQQQPSTNERFYAVPVPPNTTISLAWLSNEATRLYAGRYFIAGRVYLSRNLFITLCQDIAALRLYSATSDASSAQFNHAGGICTVTVGRFENDEYAYFERES
jgi:hypothetical protein